MFPKIVVPPNGWFIMENPIKILDDSGVPLFSETPIFLQFCNQQFVKKAGHSSFPISPLEVMFGDIKLSLRSCVRTFWVVLTWFRYNLDTSDFQFQYLNCASDSPLKGRQWLKIDCGD